MKMKPTEILTGMCLIIGLISLESAGRAASVFKADVPDALNLGSSWVGGAAPGESDIAVWDHTVVNNLNSSPGANLSWAGIQVLDPAGGITVNADGNTLTNGVSGIDLSAATAGLTIACPVVLGASQSWTVASGQTLGVSGVVSGVNALGLSGGGMISLSGANTYSGGTTITGTTVEPGNAACFGASAANVTNINDYLLFDVFGNGGIIANRNYVSGTITIDMYNRGISVVLDGAWAGNGTILVTNLTTGATLTLGGNGTGGDMNSFTGSVIVADTNSDGNASAGSIRFNNGGSNKNVGNSNAVFNLGQGSVQFTEKNANVVTYFGALIGGPNTQLAKNENYVIGGANLDSTFAGIIQSSSSLTKVGTGTLTLTGNNPYTGTTTVRGGTLQIGDGITAGTGTLGTGAVANNAVLAFDRPDDFEVDNAISGAGTTVKQNVNTLTYGGSDTSSGVFDIRQGTLALNSIGSIGSSILLADGAKFDVTQNPAFTLSSTLSGDGAVVGTLSASGGAIAPGGAGASGTLTFSNGLTELGGVNNTFELSTPGGTNDLIAVVGDLTLNGMNTIVAGAFGGGNIAVGTYTLITYTGTLNGGLANLSASISGGFGTLTNPPGAIALIVTPPPRGATNLTWLGDGAGNAWDINTSTDWVNNSTPFIFLNGDSVAFDATGAANPMVNIAATVLPAAVAVDAAADYTFAGGGDIGGATGLTKTNSGTLTILNTNSYTGPTLIGGGTLAAVDLENGTLSSSIGAADSDPTNLVFNGGTLSYVGAGAATDRGATLGAAGANIAVAGGVDLTLNGSVVGTGALTVSGAGTLTLAAANSYTGGTVISNGVLALGSDPANNNGLGATNAPVTFYGGTLQLFGYNGSTSPNYATCYNPLVVPDGQTGTLQMFSRGPSNSGANSGLKCDLTGAGTLNLVVNYLRDNLDGDWSAFTGTIYVTGKNASGDEMRINNNFGYANAAIVLNDGVIMDRVSTANATIDIGELSGTSGALIAAGSSTAQNPTWSVGWKNTSATFAGTIGNDGVTSVTKVGSGTWTLTGNNTFSGTTTISNGVLALAYDSNTGNNGAIESSAINVMAGAELDVSGRNDGTLNVNNVLEGSGIVRGTNIGGIYIYGVVSPGDGTNGVGVGTLTVTNSTLTLYGTAWMKLSRGSSPDSDRLAATNIVLGGTLVVTNVGENLQMGDTFRLFSAPAMTGSFAAIVLPNYYTWDSSQLYVNGTVSVTGKLPPPAMTNIDFSQLANGTITFNATGGVPNGPVLVLSSTNLALPLSNWTPVATNNFDGSGNLTGLTVSTDPAAPQAFYTLQVY